MKRVYYTCSIGEKHGKWGEVEYWTNGAVRIYKLEDIPSGIRDKFTCQHCGDMTPTIYELDDFDPVLERSKFCSTCLGEYIKFLQSARDFEDFDKEKYQRVNFDDLYEDPMEVFSEVFKGCTIIPEKQDSNFNGEDSMDSITRKLKHLESIKESLNEN